MTLEKTWEECLRMWKWIAEEGVNILNADVHDRVSYLKMIWLSINGYSRIYNDCFFCDYVEKHGRSSDWKCCIYCPAQKVDEGFCCQDYGTHWSSNPIEFYERLVELNEKRLSKKGKR